MPAEEPQGIVKAQEDEKLDADEARFLEWMNAAKMRVKLAKQNHIEKKRLEKRRKKLEKNAKKDPN